MKQIIIESKFESTAAIFQIEIICEKYGKYTMRSAFIKKEEAQKHIDWLIKNNYSEENYNNFGKIYSAKINTIVLFA